LEAVARREATRTFTSFSVTRNFAYVKGYKPGYFKLAKGLKAGGTVLTGVSVAYTGSDIGTAVYSAVAAWGK